MDPALQPGPVSAPIVDLCFPHHWQAEILPSRPGILPARRFIYPRDAEEAERGALEVLVRPELIDACTDSSPFLATCVLGFRDPAVPTGIWSCPNPKEMCAVSGGYAYIINTATPDRFSMIEFRPVLEVRSLPCDGLLLFVGHRAIIAWGWDGHAWQSEKLSDEGVTINAIEDGVLHGLGWEMLTDRETPFALDLRSGLRIDSVP